MTSAPVTPKNKNTLAEIIGPSLQTSGDIFGPGDLNALLRKYPDIEKAHQKLWAQSTSVLKTVVTEAVGRPCQGRIDSCRPCHLLPRMEAAGIAAPVEKAARDTIFLIKSSPSTTNSRFGSRPSLRREGYRVFADILTLQPGDRWRRQINQALQYRAAKVLLICRDATLSDPHVQDDLDIALEMAED